MVPVFVILVAGLRPGVGREDVDGIDAAADHTFAGKDRQLGKNGKAGQEKIAVAVTVTAAAPVPATITVAATAAIAVAAAAAITVATAAAGIAAIPTGHRRTPKTDCRKRSALSIPVYAAGALGDTVSAPGGQR